MSWPTPPKVRLAVARFAPDADKPVAGLTDEERAAHREKRAAEQLKVEPAYPDWRVEELARKYSDEQPNESHYERGFYHPYG